MSAANHGGSAFPMPGADYTEDCGDFQRAAYHGPQEGMSLRDYFAAKAMQGLITAAAGMQKMDGDLLAKHAFAAADAMLRARTAC